jgi:hypothetical protein
VPFTTVVAGTVITASYGNLNIRNQVVTPFASATSRSTAVGALAVEGMTSWLSDYDDFWVHNGTVYKPLIGAPVVVKTANETVNDSTVYQDDNELFVAVAPNAVYKCHVHLIFSTYSAHNEGFKVSFTAPAGATFNAGWFETLLGTSGAVGATEANASCTGIIPTGDPSTDNVYISDFILITSATAGTLQLQWAQNTDWAVNTTVYAGSTLEARRVS